MSENEAHPEGSPSLELVLLANGVEVARSEDAKVWLSAMASMTVAGHASIPGVSNSDNFEGAESEKSESGKSALAAFADDLGVELSVLEAAADPSEATPFITFDHKYWEALKKTAGRAKTPPVVLAGTFLLLWGRHTAVGDVTTKLCGTVLRPIGLSTNSAGRALRNCDWIQYRDGTLKLNPAKISEAEELAKAYCLARE